MAIEIKDRFTERVIYSSDKATSLREAIFEAVAACADLSRADLRGADLSGAYLRGAYLSDANLSGANLSPIKQDFFDVLFSAPGEIAGLRAKLITGEVDGSCYEDECACLVGTVANLKGVDYKNIEGLLPNADRPAERFFLGISPGDTPEKNEASKLVVEWIDEFLVKCALVVSAQRKEKI